MTNIHIQTLELAQKSEKMINEIRALQQAMSFAGIISDDEPLNPFEVIERMTQHLMEEKL